jgi:hypothetical protein
MAVSRGGSGGGEVVARGRGRRNIDAALFTTSKGSMEGPQGAGRGAKAQGRGVPGTTRGSWLGAPGTCGGMATTSRGARGLGRGTRGREGEVGKERHARGTGEASRGDGGPHEVCGEKGRTTCLLGMIMTSSGVVGRNFGQGQGL